MTLLEAVTTLASGGLGSAIATGISRWALKREARLGGESAERARLSKENTRLAMTVGHLKAELDEARGDLDEARGENLALRARLERLSKGSTPP